MSTQVKTQWIIDWLEGPFIEDLDENIRRASIPAVSFAAGVLQDGLRFTKPLPYHLGKLTTAAQAATWLENDYWPLFIRRYGRNADARHAGAIAIDKAVRQLRSGEWLQN